MNNQIDATKTIIAAAFANRRQWTAKSWGKRVDASWQEIQTWSAKGEFLKHLESGRITITSDANGTRKAGRAVAYLNKVQAEEAGAALAIAEVMPYFVDYLNGDIRRLAMIDTEGDHDIIINQDTGADGLVSYRVGYAEKAYNNLGEYAGLKRTSENPVQNGIDGKLNGWTGEDGVIHVGYNQWVDKHNAAVMAYAQAQGDLAADDPAKEFLKGMTTVDQSQDGWENKFVQLNTVKHIAYGSVINHYVLAAWLLIDTSKAAFEVFTYAKTEEQFEAFLSGRDSALTRGYQNQMRKMAGIAYEATLA